MPPPPVSVESSYTESSHAESTLTDSILATKSPAQEFKPTDSTHTNPSTNHNANSKRQDSAHQSLASAQESKAIESKSKDSALATNKLTDSTRPSLEFRHTTSPSLFSLTDSKPKDSSSKDSNPKSSKHASHPSQESSLTQSQFAESSHAESTPTTKSPAPKSKIIETKIIESKTIESKPQDSKPKDSRLAIKSKLAESTPADSTPTNPSTNPNATSSTSPKRRTSNPKAFTKEIEVDEWVREKLKSLGLKPSRDFFEKNASDYLKASLKGASKTKKQTGTGIPDFVIEKYQVENCTIPVIFECKLGVKYLEKYAKDNEKTLDFSNDAISKYALNGALHYARVALQNEGLKQDHYKEILAIGIAANSEQNVELKIACVFADSSLSYKELASANLDFLENAKSFTHFYNEHCKLTESDKHLLLIKAKSHLTYHSAQLNKLMHNHNITAPQRVLYIAGMILSMQSVMSSEYRILTKGLSPADLQGLQDEGARDGQLVFERIEEFLKVKVPDSIKRKLMLDSFNEIRKDSDRDKIPKTSNHKIVSHILKEPSSINKQIFAYIYTHIYKEIDGLHGHLDIMGECYSEFLKYALGDGKELGIVLTPPYVTKMMAQILEITSSDRVMDLATGSAGFLISSMELMIEDVYKKHSKHSTHANKAILELKTKQLLGIEYNAEMFALATANMILRGDGSSKIYKANTFETEDRLYESFLPTRILLNPPFTWDYNGLPFIEFGLDRMQRHGLGAIIIQDSAGNGQATPITKSILSKHTLKASIKMPLDLFQPMAGVQTSIYIFEAQIPHDFEKPVKFIDFRNDGYKRTKKSLQKLDSPLQRYEDILKIYKQGLNAKIDNTRYENPINLEEVYVEDFISKGGNDWNFDQHKRIDTKPTLEDFKKCVSEYLAWEVSNVLKNSTQEEKGGAEGNALSPRLRELENNFRQNGGEWREFKIGELFEVVGTKSLDENKIQFVDEGINFVGRVNQNNGVKGKIVKQNFEPNEPNTITATVIGQYKYVKLQKAPYYCSQNINKLTPKFENKNKFVMYFFISHIQKFVSIFDGQQAGYKLDDLQNHKISLPVLPTQANSVRHCEALQKPKLSTQNNEQKDCFKAKASRNDDSPTPSLRGSETTEAIQSLNSKMDCHSPKGLRNDEKQTDCHEKSSDFSRNDENEAEHRDYTIAFAYMESYIRELEAERIQELEAYLKVTGLNDYTLTDKEQAALKAFENLSTANTPTRHCEALQKPKQSTQNNGQTDCHEVVPTSRNDELERLEWREFTIGELFEVGTGSLLVSQNLKQGNIPRISAKSDNNGILGYFDTEFNSEARHCENFISVNFFGDAFYHPYKASLEMKVHTLKLKNDAFTKSSGLFIAGIIRKNFYGKFTYGNQLSSSKLKNEDFRILLPVLPTQTERNDKTINFSFIESFIKAIEKQHIKSLYTFWETKIKAYNTVTNRDKPHAQTR